MNVKKIVKVLKRKALEKNYVVNRLSMLQEMQRGLVCLNLVKTPFGFIDENAISKVDKILSNSLKSQNLDLVNEKNYYGMSI